MTKNNATLNWRVTQLEKNYFDLDTKVEKILTNELPHINMGMAEANGKLDVLSTRLRYSLIANGVQVVALILGLILMLK